MTSTNALAATLRSAARRLGYGRAATLTTALAAALALLSVADLEARHEVLVVLSTLGFLAAGCGYLLRWRVTGNDAARSVGAGLVLVGLSRPAGVVTDALVDGEGPVHSPAVQMGVLAVAAATVLRAFPDAGARRRPVTMGLLVLALGGAVAVGLGGALSTPARPALAGASLALAALWGATAVAAWRSDQLSTGHRRSAQALAVIALTLSGVAALAALPALLPGSAELVGLTRDVATTAAAGAAALAAVRRLTDALSGQERYVAGLLEQLAGHERQLQQARGCLHDARAAVAGIRAATSAVQSSTAPSQATLRADLQESIAAELARLDRLLRLPDRAPRVSSTDLDQLLRPLVVSHRERGLRLRWIPTGAAPVTVDGDALAVIVGNLLGNALVHAPGAVCTVTVAVAERLTVTVADDGPGLTAARRAAAFEAGEHGAASPGEGLGLAISRDLARRHGGDLVAADAPVGCRFVLTLPLAEAAVAPALPRPRIPLEAHLALGARTVPSAVIRVTGTPALLVDDHSLFAQAVQLGLAAAGITALRVAPTSAAAIVDACRVQAPATVLLDLRLGHDEDGEPIDGLDLVAPLTAAGCRVVVVTGEVGDATWGTAVERGAITVVAKDTALEDLVALVQAVRSGDRVLPDHRRQDLLAAARLAHSEETARLAPFRSLSPREDEVLQCMAAGMPAASIAAVSYVSEATVRTHIRAVLSKLQVSSQLQAVALARQAGWLRDGPEPAR